MAILAKLISFGLSGKTSRVISTGASTPPRLFRYEDMDKVYTNVEIKNPVVNLLVVANCLTNILRAKDSLSWRSLPLSCTTFTPGHDVSGKCGVCGDPLPIIVRRATWLSRVLSLPYRVTPVTITTAPPLTFQKNRHFYFFFVGAFPLSSGLLLDDVTLPSPSCTPCVRGRVDNAPKLTFHVRSEKSAWSVLVGFLSFTHNFDFA